MTDGPADPGLLQRFRAAGERIQWRAAESAGHPHRPKGSVPLVRIAHLHDEEARVLVTEGRGGTTVLVDSGPVGALVLLLEIDRRGPPATLTAHAADERSGFPAGSIEGTWPAGGGAGPTSGLPMPDLVALARYALA